MPFVEISNIECSPQCTMQWHVLLYVGMLSAAGVVFSWTHHIKLLASSLFARMRQGMQNLAKCVRPPRGDAFHLLSEPNSHVTALATKPRLFMRNCEHAREAKTLRMRIPSLEN